MILAPISRVNRETHSLPLGGLGVGRLIPYNRQLNGKLRTLSIFAVNLDFATVQFHDLLHVGQSQAETFGIVTVAGMYAVELVENLLQIVFLDAQARIANREEQMVFSVPPLQIDVERLLRLAVFHSVVQQVVDDILEMYLIDIDG